MEEVNVGIVGLGNVGTGTLSILAENSHQIALKLGYRLKVVAVCSRSVHSKELPAGLEPVFNPPTGARWWHTPTCGSWPNW